MIRASLVLAALLTASPSFAQTNDGDAVSNAARTRLARIMSRLPERG